MIFFLLIIPFSFSIYPKYLYPSEFNPKEEEDTKSDDFGSCTCDLTFGQCDPDCCCDDDCTSKEKTDMSCFVPFKRDFLCSEGLSFGCLLWENRLLFETLEYFPDVEDRENVDSFDSSVPNIETTKINPPPKNFLSKYFDDDQQTLSSGNSYKYGDFISIYEIRNGVNMSTFMTLPFSNVECVDISSFQPIRFGESNYYVSECTLSATDSSEYETFCDTFLNIDYYQHNFFIGKYPSFSEATAAASDDDVVTLEMENNTTNKVFSSYNSSALSCEGGLKEMEMYLYYDEQTGNIIRFTSQVMTTETTFFSSSSTTTLTFHLYIMNVNSEDTENKTVSFDFGSPGYTNGAPIQSGRKVSQSFWDAENEEEEIKEAIIMKKHGLEVYTGEYCADQNGFSVPFGQDTQSSCKIPLTYTELQNLCVNGFLFSYINSSITDDSIGHFGNADGYNTDEWVDILNIWEVSLDSHPSLSDGVCEDLITEVHYTILMAKSGSVRNPQNKIVGVERTLIASDWEHQQISTTQDFYLRWKIQFFEVPDQQSSQTTVGTGIRLKPLPKNSLAPFQLDN